MMTILLAATLAAASPTPNETLAALKDNCRELLRTTPTTRASIGCSDFSLYWQKEEKTDYVPLAVIEAHSFSARTISFGQRGLISYEGTQPEECPVYTKMERKVAEVDVEVGCNEVLAIDDAEAFCKPIIAEAVARDPEIVTIRSTGVTEHFCNVGGGR